jgi:quercetin dioxygenase-like cupin family protein
MTSAVGPYGLGSTFLRLRPDATVEPLQVDETFWSRISSGELGSFHNEYLVAYFEFDRDWSTWERHPNGDEIVCLIAGTVTFVLDEGAEHREIELDRSGAYVIVPKGTWHTAKTTTSARMLFITAGEGTQIRAKA